eukprot:7378056-Prymnesium_polylepis.2
MTGRLARSHGDSPGRGACVAHDAPLQLIGPANHRMLWLLHPAAVMAGTTRTPCHPLAEGSALPAACRAALTPSLSLWRAHAFGTPSTA